MLPNRGMFGAREEGMGFCLLPAPRQVQRTGGAVWGIGYGRYCLLLGAIVYLNYICTLIVNRKEV